MLFKNNKKEKEKTINKKLKINKSFILSFFLIAFFAVPYIVFSATTGSNDFQTVKFTPQIEFPGTGISGETDLSQKPGNDGIISSNLLSTYIKAIYDYGLGVAGILAAIMIMAAGIIWLTSGGDSGKINTAKKFITGSLTGLFLLFGAYIILNTVNPKLVEIKPIEMAALENADLATIDKSSGCCIWGINSEGNYTQGIGQGEKISKTECQTKGEDSEFKEGLWSIKNDEGNYVCSANHSYVQTVNDNNCFATGSVNCNTSGFYTCDNKLCEGNINTHQICCSPIKVDNSCEKLGKEY